MQHHTPIASVRLGTLTIAGTNWPVERHVYKLGPHKWQAVTVCNGIASDERIYRTRAAALDSHAWPRSPKD